MVSPVDKMVGLAQVYPGQAIEISHREILSTNQRMISSRSKRLPGKTETVVDLTRADAMVVEYVPGSFR